MNFSLVWVILIIFRWLPHPYHKPIEQMTTTTTAPQFGSLETQLFCFLLFRGCSSLLEKMCISADEMNTKVNFIHLFLQRFFQIKKICPLIGLVVMA